MTFLTCHLLLVTCYSSLVTRHLSLVSGHLIIPYVQGKAKFILLTPAFLIASFLPFSVKAQTVQDRHQQIRAAMEARDLPQSIQQLRALQNAEPRLFAINNYDYLLARLSEQNGDNAVAQANYQAVLVRNSALAGHAQWHLAQLARSSGDLVLEREQLRRFIASAPPGAQRETGILRLGESFWESSDYSGTIASLRPLLTSKNVPLARAAMNLSAQAFERSGKPAEARSWFNRLLFEMPDAARPDDFALAAVRGLDALDASVGGLAQLSEADRLLRASVYQFNRDFEAARKHYQSIVEHSAGKPTVPNAVYQTGRGFYQQGQYDEALKHLQRVVQEFPESSSARDALSFTAGAYNRLKRTDDAVAAYKQFINRYPDAPNPERTYINIVDALHEAGRHKEALDWVQQTRSRFAGQLGATLGLFAQLRIHLAQADWSAVVADAERLKQFSDLGGTRVPSGTSQAEVTFLQAFALEQLGRTSEAIDLYLSIPDGRNDYYGQLATARLQGMAADPKSQAGLKSREQAQLAAARQLKSEPDKARSAASAALRLSTSPESRTEALGILKEAYRSLPAYSFPVLNLVPLGRLTPINESSSSAPTQIADELFFLALYDEAVPALAEIIPRPLQAEATSPTGAAPSPANMNYTIALFSLRGGLANRAVRFGETLWRPLPGDYVLELAPREFAELLYPAPYRESLMKHAPARGVDPRLVLAIARQESRFMFEAKSVAAARGMMQFIPETANDMARQLGKTSFVQDELYAPDTAILFGAQYLSGLFKQFPGQTEAVAAAYNGGPDNVARWIGRSRSSEPERYVPEIGFTQTKDYVFKVMTNLRAYQQLYPQLYGQLQE